MKTFTKILKFITLTFAVVLGSFFVYANLEEPPLHASVKPVSMTILRANDVKNKKTNIEKSLKEAQGITAFTVNPESNLVSITFDPEIISKQKLQEIVGKSAPQTKVANFDSNEPSGPQCPVPMEYILKFERLKYAFCIR